MWRPPTNLLPHLAAIFALLVFFAIPAGAAEGKMRRPLDLIAQSPWLSPSRENATRLTVQEAIRCAIENSFKIKRAKLNTTIQGLQVGVEEALFIPKLNVKSDYGKNREATSSFLDIGSQGLSGVRTHPYNTWRNSVMLEGKAPFGTIYRLGFNHARLDYPLSFGSLYGINPQHDLGGSVEVIQPLLKGRGSFYNTSRIKIAGNDRAMADHELALVAGNLIFNVEANYWRLQFALKNLEAKAGALQASADNLENIKVERAEGAEAEADVITARSNLALRRIEFKEAETFLENTCEKLLDAMNPSGGASRARGWRGTGKAALPGGGMLLPVSEPDAEAFLPSQKQAYNTAFLHRADYKHIKLKIENQRIEVNVSEHEKLPELNLRGRWDQLGLDDRPGRSFSSFGSGDYYNWSVGLELVLNLSSDGPGNRCRQSRKKLESMALQQRQLEHKIIADVNLTLRNLSALHQRVKDLEKRVALQKDLLGKEREKLKLGEAVYYTVSLMENDLIEGEALVLRALADYETEKAKYHLITGTLLNKRDLTVKPD